MRLADRPTLMGMLLAILAVSGAPHLVGAQTLLANGTAEVLSIDGWLSDYYGCGSWGVTGTTWLDARTGTSPPQGSYVFWGGPIDAARDCRRQMDQIVDVSGYVGPIDLGDAIVVFEGWFFVKPPFGPDVEVSIGFLRVDGSLSGSYWHHTITAASEWQHVVLPALALPPTTRAVKVILQTEVPRSTSIYSVDVFADLLRLNVLSPVTAETQSIGRVKALYR